MVSRNANHPWNTVGQHLFVSVYQPSQIGDAGLRKHQRSTGWWFLATPLKNRSSSIGMILETQY